MLSTPSQSQPTSPQQSAPVQGHIPAALAVCPTCGKALEGSPQPYPQPQPFPSPDPDEINLLEYIYVLVKHKWWIIGATVFGLVFGYVAALIKGPTYVAEAVIAAKEADNAESSSLSGLGALGGLVANQFNISASPGLDKIDLILESRKFNAELITKYDLLPMIYKNKWPKLFRKYFDTASMSWDSTFVRPKMLAMGEFVKNYYIKKVANRNNTMTLRIESTDSVFSDTLLSKYLTYLNEYIQITVQSDARENVSYLENQLLTMADPLLREKIQNLIANELEKQMLVSKEAFRVVDPSYSEISNREKQLFPLLSSISLFSIVTVLVILFHALSKGEKTEEDREYIKRIKAALHNL